MRRNNGRGGMQTSGASSSITCPYCGKPAACKEGEAYMHFTKKGVVWHVWDGTKWVRRQNQELRDE
jgi:hypothetical protein